MTKRFPFQLRGAEGSVVVSFQANEDPERWGYGTLGLTWPVDARGHPHELHQPALLDASHWADALPLLREAFPEWQFKPESPS
jgi:hypothetical protein